MEHVSGDSLTNSLLDESEYLLKLQISTLRSAMPRRAELRWKMEKLSM